MYRLTVCGGEYEDAFKHIYYSNSFEKLKKEGIKELTYYEEAYGFYIHEIKLEGNEVQSDPYLNPLYSVDTEDVRNEINFKKLTDILKDNEAITVLFYCNGRYSNDEIAYNVEITRVDKNKINVTKFDDKSDIILNVKECTKENCEGSFVEQVIDDYDMYMRDGEE